MQKQSPSQPPADTERPLKLAPEPQDAAGIPERNWKILVVDDEHEIHDVTRLALDGLECRGRHLQFLNAYSGKEACKIAREVPDIAVILLDVVMETDHAGLDVVRYIREELNNNFVRITNRGQAVRDDHRSTIVHELFQSLANLLFADCVQMRRRLIQY